MKRLLFILLVFVCSVSYGQVYQSMPQAGYGPVQRMLFDSVVTLPMGITRLRNISGGRDTAQIRYNKADSSIYVYTGSQWVKSSGSGGASTDTTSLSNRINLKVNISDTANKWISAVSKPNDSSLSFTKGTTVTTYSISAVNTAKRLITIVYNKSGATIIKGSVIYIDGAHSSNLPTIALAQANNESTSAYTYGLVETDIPDNNQGTVIQSGIITNLNLPTSTYTDGQTLYLSPTVAGGYTLTKPLAPNHYVAIGTITRAHPTLGTIQIAIRNGFQLDELSDVLIPLVPNDSTVLQFSRVDSLWHAISPTNVIGGYGWKTSGNSDVNAGRFIGSTNNASLRFRTNNTETMVLDSLGKLKINGFANNGTYNNAFALTNTNNRAFFNLNTNSSISQISLKANNDAVGDSMIINDSGLIAPRTNATLWLKPSQSGSYNVVANRCASCGSGSIFSANVGTSAPVFNVTSTGATSIGASSAAASSLVDMSSTSLGLLIPRMTTTQRNAISSPAMGLQVYDLTDSINYAYDGAKWEQYLSNRGNRFASGSDYIGTNNNVSLRFRTNGTERMVIDSVGKVGINVNPSTYMLDITDVSTGGTGARIKNVSTGTIASAGIIMENSTGQGSLFKCSSGFTTNGVFTANSLGFYNGTSGNIAIASQSGNVVFSAGSLVEKMRLSTAGNLLIGTTTDNSTLTTNGSFATGYVAKSANYTATISDYTINCTANTFQVTLPTAAGITGRIYTIVNSGAGTITIGTTSSQTFVNVALTPTTLSMATVGTRVVQSNGANWLLISSL
jgi:hypothetical protein